MCRRWDKHVAADTDIRLEQGLGGNGFNVGHGSSARRCPRYTEGGTAGASAHSRTPVCHATCEGSDAQAYTAGNRHLPLPNQEFDLSKLSPEEKAAIEHRKALERVCRYPVDELHARAVSAEAEIGALVVYLMNKHGAHGVCEQKDRRGAVRGQLSILRQLVDTFIQEEAMQEQEQHEQMVAYLRGVSVFEQVNESTLHANAGSLDVSTYREGETILQKGEPGTTFFLIKDGTVGFSLEVTPLSLVLLDGCARSLLQTGALKAGLMRARSQDDGKIQKTRTNPEFFGEISLLSEDNLITATAIAKTKCECYTLQVRPQPLLVSRQWRKSRVRPLLPALKRRICAA